MVSIKAFFAFSSIRSIMPVFHSSIFIAYLEANYYFTRYKGQKFLLRKQFNTRRI